VVKVDGSIDATRPGTSSRSTGRRPRSDRVIQLTGGDARPGRRRAAERIHDPPVIARRPRAREGARRGFCSCTPRAWLRSPGAGVGPSSRSIRGRPQRGVPERRSRGLPPAGPRARPADLARSRRSRCRPGRLSADARYRGVRTSPRGGGRDDRHHAAGEVTLQTRIAQRDRAACRRAATSPGLPTGLARSRLPGRDLRSARPAGGLAFELTQPASSAGLASERSARWLTRSHSRLGLVLRRRRLMVATCWQRLGLSRSRVRRLSPARSRSGSRRSRSRADRRRRSPASCTMFGLTVRAVARAHHLHTEGTGRLVETCGSRPRPGVQKGTLAGPGWRA
jgi:hypothetical protein